MFVAMNRYDNMKIELLSGAKAASEYLPIRIHELALKYGIEQRHVCEKLVEFHAEKLLRLSAWDDNESRDKPFNEWPDAAVFFASRWDGNYKRVQLLVRGSEFLENLAASELPSGGEQRNEGRNSVPSARRMQPTPSKKVDWKSLTPESLIDAVNHVRGRFEEEEFKFGFVTQQNCYKELHPVAAMEIAPGVFKHYMDVYEAGLKQATDKAFGDLFEIGLANGHLLSQGPIEWAKSHLEFLILGKEYKIKIWIKNVCDQQEMSKNTTPEEMEEFIHWRTWRAPRLIVMQPSANVPYDPASTWSRENEEQTERFLSALSERFVQGLCFYLDRIVGEAHVKLAKQGKPLKRPARELPVKIESAEKPDPNIPTPVAFISYSWDSGGHKQWVLDLATRLQGDGGVQIVLDRWHLPPGDDRTVFMEKSVVSSKFVILVCTPAYAARANNREGGVGYEATIITAELAENINQRKFIPVLRDGDWKSSLPVWIKNKVGVYRPRFLGH